MVEVLEALAWAAADVDPCFTFLDGGPGRGWLGVRATEEIVADDLLALDEVEARWRAEPDAVWMGWLTYDLGAAAQLGRTPRPGRLPGLCLRRFETVWAFAGSSSTRRGPPVELAAPDRGWLEDGAEWPFGPLSAAMPPAEYRARVQRAREFIAAGETYQINLSQGFSAPWATAAPGGREEPVRDRAVEVARGYAALRHRAPASMGGLVRFDGGWILSNSPETLLDVRLGPADVARSWPIKGTRPRGRDPAEDDALRSALRDSPKDRAEHVMIVDLVRNDLGRLALPGTVRAPARPSLVCLPTVHHLVSEVEAVLRPGWTLRSLVSAMFPGGSITGAPKHRTLELIDALEGEARELYCGSLLVLEPGGVRFDIAIRTAIVDAGGLSVRGGGGIVIDSDPEAERLETVAKVRAFAG